MRILLTLLLFSMLPTTLLASNIINDYDIVVFYNPKTIDGSNIKKSRENALRFCLSRNLNGLETFMVRDAHDEDKINDIDSNGESSNTGVKDSSEILNRVSCKKY